MVALATCPVGGAPSGDGRCVPAGVLNPPATWVLDYLVPALGLVVLIALVTASVRRRTLRWSLLIAVASASTWWLETFGDWGQHLSYSPNFYHYVLDWPFTAPHNPDWMPVMYAVYWVAHAWAILAVARYWQKKRPGTGLGRAILTLSVPLTFVWNLVVEGAATALGWWTYDPPIGPYVTLGRGHWPLLWPMLVMFGWINLIAWVVGPPGEQHRLNRMERLCRLDRLLSRPGWASVPRVRAAQPALPHPVADTTAPTGAAGGGGPGSGTAVASAVTATATPPDVQPDAGVQPDPASGTWRFQTVRLLAWIVFFNVTFFLTLDVPLVAVRMISGWGSPFLP